MSDKGLKEKIEGAIPRIALSLSGTIMALALSLNLAGLNFSQPLNTYFQAKAEALKLEITQCKNSDIIDRIETLEKQAHYPDKGGDQNAKRRKAEKATKEN